MLTIAFFARAQDLTVRSGGAFRRARRSRRPLRTTGCRQPEQSPRYARPGRNKRPQRGLRPQPTAVSCQRSAQTASTTALRTSIVVRFHRSSATAWRNHGAKHKRLYQEDLLISSHRTKKLRPHSKVQAVGPHATPCRARPVSWSGSPGATRPLASGQVRLASSFR